MKVGDFPVARTIDCKIDFNWAKEALSDYSISANVKSITALIKQLKVAKSEDPTMIPRMDHSLRPKSSKPL